MTAIKPYRRAHAVEYAKTWALSRNPLFSRFDSFGGDCTNFVSQCLFAGSCVMNETPTFGWYYRAAGDYAPAWTGVPYLYNFLTENMEVGPFGAEIPIDTAMPGDVIQLGRRDGTYYHTLIVVGMRDGVPLICAHDNDALDRPLDTYTFDRARCIHISGVRIVLPVWDCCYAGMLAGTSIFPDETSANALTCYPPEPEEETPAQEETDTASGELPADVLPPDFVPPQPQDAGLSELPAEEA